MDVQHLVSSSRWAVVSTAGGLSHIVGPAGMQPQQSDAPASSEIAQDASEEVTDHKDGSGSVRGFLVDTGGI